MVFVDRIVFLLFYSVKSRKMLFLYPSFRFSRIAFYVKYVNNILEMPICVPLQPVLTPLFLPFCRGEKYHRRHIFLAPRANFCS